LVQKRTPEGHVETVVCGLECKTSDENDDEVVEGEIVQKIS
jgi:hypothetical protein